MKVPTVRCLAKVLVLGVLAGMFVFPAAGWSEIYKYIDKDGVMHFTNVPVNPGPRRFLPPSSCPTRPLPQLQPYTQYSSYRPLLPSRETVADPSAYDPHIRFVCQRHGMDYNLVKAVIRAESAFDCQAVSPKGAKGLMQLMPGTSRDLGVENPFDPYQNIDGGVRYLKELLHRFNNNVAFALAAYNAGPENVEKYGGIPPYDETQTYVERVLNLYARYTR